MDPRPNWAKGAQQAKLGQMGPMGRPNWAKWAVCLHMFQHLTHNVQKRCTICFNTLRHYFVERMLFVKKRLYISKICSFWEGSVPLKYIHCIHLAHLIHVSSPLWDSHHGGSRCESWLWSWDEFQSLLVSLLVLCEFLGLFVSCEHLNLVDFPLGSAPCSGESLIIMELNHAVHTEFLPALLFQPKSRQYLRCIRLKIHIVINLMMGCYFQHANLKWWTNSGLIVDRYGQIADRSWTIVDK